MSRALCLTFFIFGQRITKFNFMLFLRAELRDFARHEPAYFRLKSAILTFF